MFLAFYLCGKVAVTLLLHCCYNVLCMQQGVCWHAFFCFLCLARFLWEMGVATSHAQLFQKAVNGCYIMVPMSWGLVAGVLCSRGVFVCVFGGCATLGCSIVAVVSIGVD